MNAFKSLSESHKKRILEQIRSRKQAEARSPSPQKCSPRSERHHSPALGSQSLKSLEACPEDSQDYYF
jgi:hypothetical protein